VSLDAPACVLLEIEASLRLFGGLHSLMDRAATGCRALGYAPQIAAAPTPRAARWLAQAGIAARIERAQDLPQALGPLPVDVLDAPPQTLEMLFGIGALTLADCLRLPRAGLARRGAAALTLALDQALGRLPEPRPWFEPPARYAFRIELPVPAAHGEPLTFAARRLFAGLAAWLAARHAGVERYTLQLEHEAAPPTSLTVVLGEASRDARRFELLAREHLARLQLAQPATAVVLEADAIEALAGASGGLFGDARRADEEGRLLVERLRARLGPGTVSGLQPRAEHRPERAWQFVEPGSRALRLVLPGPRPVWLLAPPQPLAMQQDVPCWQGPLALLAGPERIESGWWDGGDVLRDYFVAAAPAAELLWVYRELTPPQAWYLHGLFG
jgi:protein ImuB